MKKFVTYSNVSYVFMYVRWPLLMAVKLTPVLFFKRFFGESFKDKQNIVLQTI